MPFVKLDCGILNSTIWFDREAREVFLTALLMAEPHELLEPTAEIATASLALTEWFVPPGFYGFVHAAGPGIIRRAGLDQEPGMAALARLAAPDDGSRTPDFGGRRLVRVDGGFIVLNFQKYRDRDYTAAERQRRWRERRKVKGNAVTSYSNAVMSRNITQAEAEAEAEAETHTEGGNGGAGQTARARGPRFERPTLPEVREFIESKGLQVDPVAWISHYESNGWKVGRNPMRSWRHAVWSWQQRLNERKTP